MEPVNIELLFLLLLVVSCILAENCGVNGRDCQCYSAEPSDTGYSLVHIVRCRNKQLLLVPNLSKLDRSVPIKSLDLSGNMFGDLNGNMFNGLNISFLNLDRNRALREIGEEAFTGVQNLRILSCVECEMLKTVPAIFSLTPGLEELDLTACGITKIQDGVFQDAQLTTLVLSENKLILNADSFKGLEGTLEKLFLYDAGLSTIPSAALHNLTKLKSIGLQKNNIKHISSNAIAPLPGSLISIDLSFNGIRTIEKKAFGSFFKRNTPFILVLTGNNLTDISFITSEQFDLESEVRILLYDNPLVCGKQTCLGKSAGVTLFGTCQDGSNNTVLKVLRPGAENSYLMESCQIDYNVEQSNVKTAVVSSVCVIALLVIIIAVVVVLWFRLKKRRRNVKRQEPQVEIPLTQPVDHPTQSTSRQSETQVEGETTC